MLKSKRLLAPAVLALGLCIFASGCREPADPPPRQIDLDEGRAIEIEAHRDRVRTTLEKERDLATGSEERATETDEDAGTDAEGPAGREP